MAEAVAAAPARGLDAMLDMPLDEIAKEKRRMRMEEKKKVRPGNGLVYTFWCETFGVSVR